MKKTLFILPILAILLASCSSSTPTPPPQISTTGPSQPVNVQAGEDLKIVIDSNPTTGYHWEIVGSPDAKLVQFVSTEYKTNQPVIPGSGGVDIWTFKTLSNGETKITLGYYPPGQNTDPQKTATFDVVIK